MSELSNVQVERNGAVVEFVKTEVKKGASKGQIFLGPAEVTDENLPNWLSWLGNGIVRQIISAVVRQRAKGWSDEAEDESATQKDGERVVAFDASRYMDIFKQMAMDFNLRGETIGQLKEQIEELTEKFASLSYDTPQQMLEAKELAQQIKALQIAIQSKRRTKNEEVPA